MVFDSLTLLLINLDSLYTSGSKIKCLNWAPLSMRMPVNSVLYNPKLTVCFVLHASGGLFSSSICVYCKPCYGDNMRDASVLSLKKLPR